MEDALAEEDGQTDTGAGEGEFGGMSAVGETEADVRQ